MLVKQSLRSVRLPTCTTTHQIVTGKIVRWQSSKVFQRTRCSTATCRPEQAEGAGRCGPESELPSEMNALNVQI